MEDLVKAILFQNCYQKKRVLVTGHTGFKGSWLSVWLKYLQADVVGYALPPPTEPSHYELLHLDMPSIIGDIRDFETFCETVKTYQPEIIFHLAAQPLVRQSYQTPRETFETNIMGTVNVLEACRRYPCIKAVVVVSSDKCYENQEWVWGYRENDRVGGYDPYSASKGCSELVTSSYRNAFFPPGRYGQHHSKLIASVRAGNVIGGGDWGTDRLIPDFMKAVSSNQPVTIRNPQAIRPWQHVLESLSGYLLVGQKLLEGEKNCASAWNFGPPSHDDVNVGDLAKQIVALWKGGHITYADSKETDEFHEAGLLRLDCSKAHSLLSWKPVWNSPENIIQKTVDWYHQYYQQNKIISLAQLEQYVQDAKDSRAIWTISEGTEGS